MPDLVGVVTVYTDRQHIHSHLLEFRIFDGNCRQFRGSDAGEVSRIEAKHHPVASIVGESDLLSRALMIRLGGEIGRLFTYLYAHLIYLLSSIGNRSVRFTAVDRY